MFGCILSSGVDGVAKIDRYEALIAIATHGGIAKAAAALDITISALIKRVKAVESKAGVQLVVRRPGPGEHPLTRSGRVLLDHAKRVVTADQAFDDAVANLRDVGGSPRRFQRDA
jgi:DNA-binding transcriptional LysR family regulator